MAKSLVLGSEGPDFKLHTSCLLAFWHQGYSTQKMKNKNYWPTCQSDPVGERPNDSMY